MTVREILDFLARCQGVVSQAGMFSSELTIVDLFIKLYLSLLVTLKMNQYRT